MKILVPVKRVIDYSVQVRVREDERGVESHRVKMSMNPFDEIALEEAVRLKEAGTAEEVVAVTCGTGACEDVLRSALAVGADRVMLVETDVVLQPLAVARLLRAVAEREQPGLVICGKQAIDDDANQTGQMLAALLGWPQATFVSKVALGDRAIRVSREIDNGLETLEVDLPAVLTTDLRLNEPRYATLPNILKARKQSVERLSPAELGLAPAALEPRLEVLRVRQAALHREGRRLNDVRELVRALREEGVL